MVTAWQFFASAAEPLLVASVLAAETTGTFHILWKLLIVYSHWVHVGMESIWNMASLV